MTFPFQQNDGGRSKSKRSKQKNDCVIRAFAIAYNQDYDFTYDVMADAGRRCGRGTAKSIWKNWIEDRGTKISFPAVKGQKRMTPVEFCQKFPKGRFVLSMAKHLCAVIDGVVHDDCEPREDACVYNAWEVLKHCMGEEKTS